MPQPIRVLFEDNPLPMWIHDRATTAFLAVNEAAVQHYGYSREEFLAMHVPDLVLPKDTLGMSSPDDVTGTVGVWKHRTRDGRVVEVEVRSGDIKYGGKDAVLVLAHDVTERRRAAAALRSRARQQAVVAALGQSALAGTPLPVLMDHAVNALASALGAEYSQVLELLPDGRTLLVRAGVGWRAGHVGHTTIDTRDDALGGETLLSGEPVIVDDLRTELRPSASPLVEHGVKGGVTVVIPGHERPFGVLGVHTRERRTFTTHDVHFVQSMANVLATAIERQHTEDALRSSEEKYRSVVANIPCVTWTVSARGVITFVSPKILDVLGWSVDEVLASRTHPWLERAHPEDADRVKKAYEALLARDEGFDVEYRTLRKDGTLIWLHERAMTGYEHDGVRYADGVTEDVTDRRRLEEELLQAQKMEAVGRLAGGVAHDFNNLLTAITGYSEFLLRSLDKEDPRRSDAQEIRKAAERAASLTHQLLAFSRRQVLAPKVIDLGVVVGDVEKMLRRLIGEDVEFVTHYGDSLGHVKADPGQMAQVVMNLVVNARDAMPNGGKLTIETDNVELDPSYTRQHSDVMPGPYVMLAVSDTGCGMEPAVLSRIFEPFFTTKEPGRGTGLGLSTVYGIVKQSGGHLAVWSEPGRGTTFRVYLPRVDEAPSEVEKQRTFPPTQRRETVLLVEDEPVVRTLARSILERNGYMVLTAGDGGEAERMCERYQDPIHLMLTDVVMPGVHGGELARRLTSRRPDMKVLFMSGYADRSVLQNGMLHGGTNFLQKPFTRSGLIAKVREVLDTQ